MVSSTSSNAYPATRSRRGIAGGGCAQQPGEPGQRDQEPRGDRVELADVAEGERPQERAQRRGRVGPGEDPAHPAVPQQRHVVDRVRAGDHPRRPARRPSTRRSRPCRSAPSDAHRPDPAARRTRPARAPEPGRRPTRDSDRRTPPTSPEACERVASQRCPSGLKRWNRRKSQSPSHARASSRLRHAHRDHSSSVDPGLDP